MTPTESTIDWDKSEVLRVLASQPGTQYQQATAAEQARVRTWVKELLIASVITVNFVKADGTARSMRCTLDAARTPSRPMGSIFLSTVQNSDGLVESKKLRKEPDPHSVRVWDIEKGEWRSFRFDRVQKITAELDFAAK